MPLVRRTRATLRSAEFGFFGVFVYTRVQTPRRWGAPFRAAVFVLVDFDSRPLRTSCWIVGTDVLTRCERGGPTRNASAFGPTDNATGAAVPAATRPLAWRFMLMVSLRRLRSTMASRWRS